MNTASRSPIKDPPLRLPGQSLTEERDRIVVDNLVPPMLAAVLLVVVAGLEWWRYFVPQAPDPWMWTLIAMAGVAWSVWRVFKARPKLKALRQAIDGERTVGHFWNAAFRWMMSSRPGRTEFQRDHS